MKSVLHFEPALSWWALELCNNAVLWSRVWWAIWSSVQTWQQRVRFFVRSTVYTNVTSVMDYVFEKDALWKKQSYSKYWVAESLWRAILENCSYFWGPHEPLRNALKLEGCEQSTTSMESWLRRTVPVAPQRSLIGSTDLVLVARDGVERAHQAICYFKCSSLISLWSGNPG